MHLGEVLFFSLVGFALLVGSGFTMPWGGQCLAIQMHCCDDDRLVIFQHLGAVFERRRVLFQGRHDDGLIVLHTLRGVFSMNDMEL